MHPTKGQKQGSRRKQKKDQSRQKRTQTRTKKNTPPPRTDAVRPDRPPATTPYGRGIDTSRPIRLNRILSSAGITSRRKADEWIRQGRVRVNGQPIQELGTTALWGRDIITVDHQPVPGPSDRVYLMLNKPFGVVCTLDDPQNRPVVTDLIQAISVRVYPVGRLDFDSLGLLLLTNDGEWTYRLTHPSYELPRTYKVTVSGQIPEAALISLRKGVTLDDGPSGPSKADLIHQSPGRSILRVTITQGRTRQVRRMMDAVGFKTLQLMRTAFGTLTLGDLKVGHYRHLTPDEVRAMRKQVGLA